MLYESLPNCISRYSDHCSSFSFDSKQRVVGVGEGGKLSLQNPQQAFLWIKSVWLFECFLFPTSRLPWLLWTFRFFSRAWYFVALSMHTRDVQRCSSVSILICCLEHFLLNQSSRQGRRSRGGWGGFSPPTFEENDILFCFSICSYSRKYIRVFAR